MDGGSLNVGSGASPCKPRSLLMQGLHTTGDDLDGDDDGRWGLTKATATA